VQSRAEPTAINGAVPRSVDISRTSPPAAHVPSHAAPVAPAPRAPEPPTSVDPAPVARLATSGPDTAPRRYPDAELGNTWFSAKPRPAAESADPGVAAAGADATAPTPHAEDTAQHPTASTQHPTVPTQHPSASTQPTAAAQHPTAPAQQPVHDGQPADDAAETPGTARPAPGIGEQRAGAGQPVSHGHVPPQAAGAGVVLDLDITSLVNGLGTTAGQPAVTPVGTPPQTPGITRDRDAGKHQGTGEDREAGKDRGTGKDWRTAAHPDVAETAPPVRPLKPLAAADLEAIRWRLDGGTLREVVDDRDALRELGDRLDGPLSEDQDNVTRAGLLSVRAEVYRLLGELGMAAAASRLALVQAESSGDVQAIVIAQAELAHVLRLRGDFAEADRLFEQAAGSEAPELLRSVVHENAGRCCFDQGRHMEALDHFARAVRLGAADDVDLVERIGVSLEAVYIHVLRDGWGPYPRLRREILGPAGAAR
jgi:hypothetical protein